MRTTLCCLTAILVILAGWTSSADAYQTASSFQFPLPSWNVGNNGFWSCYVSCYHLAEDVGAPHGTAVYSCANGLVKEARYSNGYGGIVVIEHYTGSEYVTTITGHMFSSSLQVSAGQEVSKGQLIGYVADYDNNGHWTSEHVHFGIHKGSYQTGNSCDGHWVYAGYDYSGCTYSNWYTPTSFVNSHQSTYACQWVSQNPSSVLSLYPGNTFTFSVTYKNTGTTAWESTGGTSNPNWCELRSCDVNGNVANSWLYPGDGQGWINAQRVTTTGGTTQPQGNGTFTFTGKVPANASPGSYNIYFRPYHATGGYLQNWGGMHFQIQVENPPDPPSYSTALLGLNPSASVDVVQGASRSFTVQFQNTGNTTWYNNSGAHPADYVCLKAVDQNGSVSASPLNTPTDGTLGWLDSQTPCTMQEASVGPGGTATFTFTGRVAATQPLGSFAAYFRPSHATAGLLNGWTSGAHFTVNAIAPPLQYTLVPLVGDWNGNGIDKIGVYDEAASRFYFDVNNDGVLDSTLVFGSPGDVPLVGNWTGSGSWHVGLYRPSNQSFWLDYDGDGSPDWWGFYGDPGDKPVVGDWDGNGTMTIGLYRPSNMSYWLDNDNNCVPDWWACFGNGGDVPLVGDWDGDGDWTIGVYRPSGYSFWLDYDNNLVPEWWGQYGNPGDKPIIGDWDGNNTMTIGVYRPADSTFWMDYNNDCVPDRWIDLRSGGFGKRSTDGRTAGIPATFALAQNYPNPFNPATTITYSLPATAHVTLDVYNVLGQRVTRLVDEQQSAGEHVAKWDALRNASGVYFYRLQAGEATETKKMLLLK